MDIVPVIFLIVIAAIVLVPQYLRFKERERLHETLRLAFERGQPLPPELIEMLQSSRSPLRNEQVAYERYADVPDRAHRDLRRGVVWLAVGVGCVLIGAAFYAGLYYVGGAEETFASFTAIGAIPACIGMAFIGLWFFTRKSTRL
ncbi:MAG: DUF6249 domain-containing protein [Caulobacteraceae bacterium]